MVDHYPELAGFLAKHTARLMKIFPTMTDFLLLSGYLFSVAETLLF